jgi:gamma-glutamylcyclotransferase (GGCT)/AIG2-like uncharacterized protein YtfP
MSEKVFAYGSNMCSGRLREYKVTPEEPGRTAVLRDYRLVFNKESRDGSGKANVEIQTGSAVWGVLHSIKEVDLRRLDTGEVGYRRQRVVIYTSDGTATETWIYIATSPSGDRGLRPYTWYKRFLVEGGKAHSLPQEHINALEGIEAIQDQDELRDRRNRAITCFDS